MKSIELFAGVGGVSLAAEWAGIETVAFCEIEPFNQKVLRKHWPDVPIFPDVKKLTRKLLEETGVIEKNGTIDLVSGGFHCQPHCTVNKERKGAADERHLWPEMFRIIEELNPNWVVGENVADYSRSDEHEQTHKDLEGYGYETQTFLIPAYAVGAPHRRYRTFIVAHSGREPELQTDQEAGSIGSKGDPWRDIARWYRRKTSGTYWEVHQPPIPGVDDGVSGGLDESRKLRSMSLGNAVVPQQIYPIFKTIMDIERGLITC